VANNKDQERKRGLGHGQFDNGDGGDSDGENDADDNDKRDDDSFYGNDNEDGGCMSNSSSSLWILGADPDADDGNDDDNEDDGWAPPRNVTFINHWDDPLGGQGLRWDTTQNISTSTSTSTSTSSTSTSSTMAVTITQVPRRWKLIQGNVAFVGEKTSVR
jgi:hypothetical protein